MTTNSRPIVRQALTRRAALTGLESNTEVRPRGILLCKELPITFSQGTKIKRLFAWFNYAGYLPAMANYYR
jgi:hypothetical protein